MRDRSFAALVLLLAVGCKSGENEPAAGTPATPPSVSAPTPATPAPVVGATAPEGGAPAAPSDPPATGPAAPSAPAAPAEAEPPADGRRAALETAWRARACLLKRQDRTGAAAIDTAGGFKDAADFAAQWAAAAAADPAWATRVMTEAVTAECSPAAE